MSKQWSRIGLGALCLGLACSSLRAEDSAKRSAPIKDPAVLAALIDHYIDEGYAAKKATPAPVADDAEFFRRINLDLNGRIPLNSEARDFLGDKSADKRARAIDKLLESPHYVGNMARVYRAMLMPPGNDPQVQALAPTMEAWLRKHFVKNTPWDEMVRELLTANVAGGANMQQPGGPGGANAFAFYQANQLKPENLAASTSRLFLGVSIQCAQCHDHKFAKWTRRQFWEYAAFFSGIGPQMPQQPQADDDPDFSQATDAAHRHTIKMPGKDDIIQARFLDGKKPDWKNEDLSTREALAQWMTAPDNPFFAKAAVNRVWSMLFGMGIVDPPDDIRDENPASHPELLDALAQAFVDNKYDLKFLIKAITLSKTYQRTSALEGATDDPRLFTRMAVKALTAEQLYDSIALATGFTEQGGDPNAFLNPFGGGGARAEFINRFSNSADRPTETQTSILQALQLMNGKISGDATSLIMSKPNNTLAAATDAPFLETTRDKLDLLYLSALGRRMRPNEAERLVKYVEKGGPSGDQNKALADVFWTLLNSSEFMFNH
jgi:hypothetical protein